MLSRLRKLAEELQGNIILDDPLRPWYNKIRRTARGQKDAWRIIAPATKARRGLDLCFWTCGMSRVMWLTENHRYCFYWNHSNTRSKCFFSAEKQTPGDRTKVYF